MSNLLSEGCAILAGDQCVCVAAAGLQIELIQQRNAQKYKHYGVDIMNIDFIDYNNCIFDVVAPIKLRDKQSTY